MNIPLAIVGIAAPVFTIVAALVWGESLPTILGLVACLVGVTIAFGASLRR
jgi:hypothetical protein